MSVSGRLGAAIGLFLVAVALIVAALFAFIRPGVPGGVMDFTAGHAAGQPVDVTLQAVGSIGFGPHPSWVSYMMKDPQTGKWVHDTTMQLPANTQINMTIYQFDSGSPLRNQVWGQVQGTIGGTASLNGKSFSVYDSYKGSGVGHTFAIPALGVSVPLAGVANPNICGVAPCGQNWPHNTVTFSFKTKGPGNYNWQCFVPCGLSFLFGNGGGMSTQNYMGGFVKVVA
jgi:hypothetical protein